MTRMFTLSLVMSFLSACAQLQTTDCRTWPIEPARGGTCAVSKQAGVNTDFWTENLAPRKWRFILQDLEDPRAQEFFYANMARKTCKSGFRKTGTDMFTLRMAQSNWQYDPASRATDPEKKFQRYIVFNFECPRDDWKGVWPSILAP